MSRRHQSFRKCLAIAGVVVALVPVSISFAESPVANVVFYDGSVTGTSRPHVITSQLVPGYTVAAGPYDGTDLDVTRLNPSSVSGFQPLAPFDVNVALPLPANQYFISTNQNKPAEAVSYFGDAGVYDPLRVEVDPPGGSYETALRIRFSAPNAATVITYSIDGGANQTWTGQDIYITKSSSVTYRGKLGPDFGTQRVAQYNVLYSNCADLDDDQFPDRLEPILRLNPLIAERDYNGNLFDDFDEFIRGANFFVPNNPNFVAPSFADTDGDTWGDYDEGLRGTDDSDPLSFPAAPNLDAVELVRSGNVSHTATGASAPPVNPVPAKPYPTTFHVEVITPGGVALSESAGTDGNWSVRTSGEQFHLVRARALDGSGRMLLALITPRALNIDYESLCASSTTANIYRTAWRTAYESRIFHTQAGLQANPRTTAEALLLNRYYEIRQGAEFAPGDENAGPDPEIVLNLRARRNEAALHAAIAAAVTPQMIDLVADYYRFHTSPRRHSMMELLADHFAGRAVPPAEVPTGVRLGNISSTATQTNAFFASLPGDETQLQGTVTVDETGFLLDVNGVSHRLQRVLDSFSTGSTLTVRALVDVDSSGFDPLPARVVEIVDRGLAPLPPPVDSDGDGLSDDWEKFYFGDLDENALGDPDGDGIINGDEYANGSNPTLKDISPPGTKWFVF